MKARIYRLEATSPDGEHSPARSVNGEDDSNVAPTQPRTMIETIVLEPSPAEKADDTRVMF